MDFIWSLTYKVIATQWTEGRGVWNKGAAGVLAATRTVEVALPFALLGFDCDNGSEFLNHHLLGYLHERKRPVAFTQSRPYHRTTARMWSRRTGSSLPPGREFAERSFAH
jgi:hypothetical protein